MRFASFSDNYKHFYGAITDAGAIALNEIFPEWPTLLAAVKAGGLDRLEEASASASVTHTEFNFEMVLPDAVRILCVGSIFPTEMQNIRTGLNSLNSCPYFRALQVGLQANRPVIRPPESIALDYEGEVAIIIGKTGRRISQEDAYGHIAALTICNEGTVRDWVRHAKFNVTQGKNWDNQARWDRGLCRSGRQAS